MNGWIDDLFLNQFSKHSKFITFGSSSLKKFSTVWWRVKHHMNEAKTTDLWHYLLNNDRINLLSKQLLNPNYLNPVYHCSADAKGKTGMAFFNVLIHFHWHPHSNLVRGRLPLWKNAWTLAKEHGGLLMKKKTQNCQSCFKNQTNQHPFVMTQECVFVRLERGIKETCSLLYSTTQ